MIPQIILLIGCSVMLLRHCVCCILKAKREIDDMIKKCDAVDANTGDAP